MGNGPAAEDACDARVTDPEGPPTRALLLQLVLVGGLGPEGPAAPSLARLADFCADEVDPEGPAASAWCLLLPPFLLGASR